MFSQAFDSERRRIMAERSFFFPFEFPDCETTRCRMSNLGIRTFLWRTSTFTGMESIQARSSTILSIGPYPKRRDGRHSEPSRNGISAPSSVLVTTFARRQAQTADTEYPSCTQRDQPCILSLPPPPPPPPSFPSPPPLLLSPVPVLIRQNPATSGMPWDHERSKGKAERLKGGQMKYPTAFFAFFFPFTICPSPRRGRDCSNSTILIGHRILISKYSVIISRTRYYHQSFPLPGSIFFFLLPFGFFRGLRHYASLNDGRVEPRQG
jgi:hypothetical protein